MKQIFSWKKRPFFYSFVITVGFAFLLSILHNLPENFYFSAAAVLYFLFLFELFNTRYFAQKILEQFGFAPLTDETALILFIHHLVLPTLAYIGIVLFLFFNADPNFNLFWLILIFILFSVLFTNIRAHYEDKYKLEELTANIYDIYTLVIAFVTADGLENAARSAGLNPGFVVALILLLLFLLALISIIRYSLLRPKVFRVVLPSFIIITLVLFLLVSSGLAAGQIALISTLMLYYIIAFLNHYRDGTLNMNVITEYVVVFLLLLVIVYGSSPSLLFR
jgi:hypothetical protein